jgi:hypothetical protein
MRLPRPRGPISRSLVTALAATPRPLPVQRHSFEPDAIHDADLQLSLWICYELSYRGFDGVDDGWEDAPGLLATRAALESRFLAALRELTGTTEAAAGEVPAEEVPRALAAVVAADDGPPLALFLQRQATERQFAEFVAHRSIYHLKEADPHSWAIPRIGGRAKAALVEIQADEYGGGRPERMHSELFRTTMRGLGLTDSYGFYVDQVPAVTLAVSNTMSLFGLHRRWTPALLGHLAALEMTSSLPNRRYGNGLRRLGHDAATTHFYDEHVEADAVHEQLAAHDLCGNYAAEHPGAAADILFGASCALAVDNAMAAYVLDRWRAGNSSLLTATSGTLAA